mmetsp:Transcript_3084/g.4158  ORF Transcript_3084/g.4158 Transcript_3084/m.4158 type:complete len:172 (+) Transcript_3084:112-627(+)
MSQNNLTVTKVSQNKSETEETDMFVLPLPLRRGCIGRCGEGFGLQADDPTILTTSSSKTVKRSNISHRIMEQENKPFGSIGDFVATLSQEMLVFMQGNPSWSFQTIRLFVRGAVDLDEEDINGQFETARRQQEPAAHQKAVALRESAVGQFETARRQQEPAVVQQEPTNKR